MRETVIKCDCSYENQLHQATYLNYWHICQERHLFAAHVLLIVPDLLMLWDVDDIVIIALLVFPANYMETYHLGHNFNYRLHYVYHLSTKTIMEFDAIRYEYDLRTKNYRKHNIDALLL